MTRSGSTRVHVFRLSTIVDCFSNRLIGVWTTKSIIILLVDIKSFALIDSRIGWSWTLHKRFLDRARHTWIWFWSYFLFWSLFRIIILVFSILLVIFQNIFSLISSKLLSLSWYCFMCFSQFLLFSLLFLLFLKEMPSCLIIFSFLSKDLIV